MSGEDDLLAKLNARKGILNNVDKFVAQEIEKDNIPLDHTYAVVAGVDNEGLRFMATVKIVDRDKYKVKVAALWDHDWDGNDTAGMRVVFSGK